VAGYAALLQLGKPVVTTSDAALVWGTSNDNASHILSRLSESGLVRRLLQGIWKVGPGRSDPREVLPVLAAPYPVYVSFWSALFNHEMIGQIPAVVHAVSLDRPKKVGTADATFHIRPVHPYLFGGMEGASPTRAGMATSEKALFDTVYLLAMRGKNVSLPELELPEGFSYPELFSWLERIHSPRLRTKVDRALQSVLDTAIAE
jgi:predicted transcriptional regulator of viral defense system